MSTFDFIVFQAMVLGLIAVIGTIFTFALPVPSNKHKAKSSSYARLFLLFIWLAQVCLSMRHLNLEWVYVAGYNLFLVGSAYILLMTVVKRYGHALRAQSVFYIAVHLVVLELTSLYFYFVVPSEPARDLVMVISCIVPLLMASARIREHLANGNVGDKVLFAVLMLCLGVVVIAAPVYLFVIGGSEVQQTMVGFLVLLVLMMLFMLAFAVSVMHSLVRRLHTQVYLDPLTGTKNRHFFYDVAPKLSAHASRNHQHLSVVVCDIDHFKNINDRYGHVVGDKALKCFAGLLQDELRSEDTLIRMGGEEFMVLSPNSTLEQARALAERLRSVVCEKPIRCSDVSFTLTASFGVVEIPENSDIFKGIREADDALFKAKHAGRNQVITVGF